MHKCSRHIFWLARSRPQNSFKSNQYAVFTHGGWRLCETQHQHNPSSSNNAVGTAAITPPSYQSLLFPVTLLEQRNEKKQCTSHHVARARYDSAKKNKKNVPDGNEIGPAPVSIDIILIAFVSSSETDAQAPPSSSCRFITPLCQFSYNNAPTRNNKQQTGGSGREERRAETGPIFNAMRHTQTGPICCTMTHIHTSMESALKRHVARLSTPKVC